MPWKVKKHLLDSRGEVYASAGSFLDDNDPYALAAKPNQVVRVQAVDAVDIAPPIILRTETQPDPEPAPATEPWPEEDEPKEESEEEDEGIDI